MDVYAQYLTVDHRKNQQDRFERSFVTDKLPIERFINKDKLSDSHHERVHKSHINMLKNCATKSNKHCLIFEDDAVWNPVGDNEQHRDLTATISQIAAEQKDWDIMMIGANAHKVVDPKLTVHDLMAPYNTKEHSTAFKKTWWGCEAYVVNHQSIDKVISYMSERGNKATYQAPCVEKIPESSGLKIVGPRRSIVKQADLTLRQYDWTV